MCRRCRTLHRSGWTLPGQWCVTTCRKHGAKDAQGSLYSRDPACHTICPLSLTSQHVKHPHTMDAVTPSVHNEHWASQMAPVCWAFNTSLLTCCITLPAAGTCSTPLEVGVWLPWGVAADACVPYSPVCWAFNTSLPTCCITLPAAGTCSTPSACGFRGAWQLTHQDKAS